MPSDSPLQISRLLLAGLGTQLHTYYGDRVPPTGALLVVSNHRSFMDAPLLMAALNRPIRFACHHYMSQVPIMREIVTQLGCFPLEASEQRQQSFFRKSIQLLQTQQAVGIFPEGAQPMVKYTSPERMGEFQRGFAHLSLRAPVPDLAVLPVAIVATQEAVNSAVPLRLLSLFDPSEPLFTQSGWHPMVVYQRATVVIGRPYWISADDRERYQGKYARSLVADLTHKCHSEIETLLHRG
ncbi:MAG TPA: lysophospholipid acyltransferase family protein [Thermosynechococcaceae cyanobacterium]